MSRKEKKTKDKGKNKNKNKNKDVLVVLFVFAMLILIAFSLTVCGKDDVDVNAQKEGVKYEDDDDDGGKDVVVITTIGIAACIVVCFIVKKSKDARKRQELLREYQEKQEERRRIEEARERVKQARRQEMIDAGIRQLTEHNGRSNRYVKNSPVGQRTRDDFDSYDLDDSRLNRYYRNKNDDLYDDLYDDLLDDDLLDNNEEDVPMTMAEKVKEWCTDYWWLIAGIVCVAVIGGIAIAYFVL